MYLRHEENGTDSGEERVVSCREQAQCREGQVRERRLPLAESLKRCPRQTNPLFAFFFFKVPSFSLFFLMVCWFEEDYVTLQMCLI